MHKSGAASECRHAAIALLCLGSCRATGRRGLLMASHLQLSPVVLDECSLKLLLEAELVIAALVGSDSPLGKGL